MESIPHNAVLAENGYVWSMYGASSHSFYYYHPDEQKYYFPKDLVLPNSRKAANVMYPGAGPIDGMIEGPDHHIYAGTALGEIYRINTSAMKLEYLGKPFPGQRIPGMAFDKNGNLGQYCGGRMVPPVIAAMK